ncbi:glycoside hydrolase family 38 C-terminal domain-containing protein [Homoserinimonas sp. OAct 916]|uniref:alpha-mannosidase n=1 Tax=Homoserinimonas sp. OAct 916 TaxID=2211450 RepID=UPI000DBE6977|nr:glycoside hydrolase family 38 C-terminal domain-containing protein [Homoserinimonas sp. OAct 916]
MHDDSALVLLTIDRFVRERLIPAIHRERMPLVITRWEAPGEPVPFSEAVTQRFEPFEVGRPWGKPWGTTWFHVTGHVPAWWQSVAECRTEVVIDLGFTPATPGFQAEGLAYLPDGTIVKAVEPRNQAVPVSQGSPVDLFIEAASNPDVTAGFTFVPTTQGDPATAGTEPIYTLMRMDLALLDDTVWNLAQDVAVLRGLFAELPAGSSRKAQILRALERAVDATDPSDLASTASDARDALADVLARPAAASAHQIHAVGHAHIDSAWLWPVRETVRKVARTFANVLELSEGNPDFVYAASSAQQYAWLKQHYPDLFARVAAAITAGQIVPVGGMWVESDTNMPGGDALARQFVAGKQFFLREFGLEPLEVWLPDSFGYSAALPQIVAQAGSRWFLTQKSSWNDTNLMPHHTFCWEGIDGTRIFTHFPPVDTYNSELSAVELARAERNFAEKGAANTSLVPFGWGDGGGGPTREMIAAARRFADLEGSPVVRLSSPRQFFEQAEAEYGDPPVWSGELYLEFHRGSFTSQARTKRGNRQSEHLLREAELWAATAAVRKGSAYPYDRLAQVWQTVLLQQFHDILPGTSIAWVHREAEHNYAAVAETLNALITSAAHEICGTGDETVHLNAGPYEQDGVPGLGGGTTGHSGAASIAHTDAGIEMANEHLRVVIDQNGEFVSLVHLATGRELVPQAARGNQLQLFHDVPNQWDAWDLDADYGQRPVDVGQAEWVAEFADEPDLVGVRVRRRFGDSTVTEEITLAGGARSVQLSFVVDWHERQKLLKLAFPFDLAADRAASEIQFGHLYRPIHTNTSWDVARFETVAHRWVHVGEPGFGAAVANDSTYGHDISRIRDTTGHTSTQVRLSLLRAPIYPDPESDQGEHRLRVSVLPGASIADAVAEGYRMNLPLRRFLAVANSTVEPLFTVDDPAVVIEAVKLAEDRSGDVIVRLYEAHGTRARAQIVRTFDAHETVETDLLERVAGEPRAVIGADGRRVDLELRPFQLVTLRYRRA